MRIYYFSWCKDRKWQSVIEFLAVSTLLTEIWCLTTHCGSLRTRDDYGLSASGHLICLGLCSVSFSSIKGTVQFYTVGRSWCRQQFITCCISLENEKRHTIKVTECDWDVDLWKTNRLRHLFRLLMLSLLGLFIKCFPNCCCGEPYSKMTNESWSKTFYIALLLFFFLVKNCWF